MKDYTNVHSVAFDITYRCNFNCLHCFNNSGGHTFELTELSDEEFLSICKEIVTLKPTFVCICGGEPLLRKELVYSVIDTITVGTSGQTQVSMVTNGFLMSKEIADRLKKSGLSNIQVSLDGFKPESHDWLRNQKGAHKKAIEALRTLNEAGVHTSVSCAPTKKNLYEFPDLVELCLDLQVKQFRVQPLMMLGKAKNYLSEHVLSEKEYIKLVGILEELKYNHLDKGLVIEWGDPIQHLTDFMANSFLKNLALNINAYGFLVTSPYIPLYTGDLRKYSLLEYMKHDYVQHIKTNLIRDICNKIKTPGEMELNSKDSRIPLNYLTRSMYADWIDNNDAYNGSLEEFLNRKVDS